MKSKAATAVASGNKRKRPADPEGKRPAAATSAAASKRKSDAVGDFIRRRSYGGTAKSRPSKPPRKSTPSAVATDAAPSSPWICHGCGNINQRVKSRCSTCAGWRGGLRDGLIPANKKLKDLPESSPARSEAADEDEAEDEAKINPSAWQQKFYELVLFQKRNGGSSIVPHDENAALAEWVRNERLLYKRYQRREIVGDEQSEHVEALEHVGFVFEAHMEKRPVRAGTEEKWQRKYEELVRYTNEHGGAYPHGNTSLGKWLNYQRMGYKEYRFLLQRSSSKYPNHRRLLPEEMPRRKRSQPREEGMERHLTQARIDKLNALAGFKWELSPQWSTWERRLEDYEKFRKEQGHGFVPQHYKDNRSLGKWVAKIRYEYTLHRRDEEHHLDKNTKRKHSQITPEKIRDLESVGFEFFGTRKGGAKEADLGQSTTTC